MCGRFIEGSCEWSRTEMIKAWDYQGMGFKSRWHAKRGDGWTEFSMMGKEGPRLEGEVSLQGEHVVYGSLYAFSIECILALKYSLLCI